MTFRSRFFSSTMTDASVFPRCMTDIGQYSARYPLADDPLFQTLRDLGSEEPPPPFQPAERPPEWFEQLIYPLESEEFFRTYWDKKPVRLTPRYDGGWLRRVAESIDHGVLDEQREDLNVKWQKNTREADAPTDGREFLAGGGTAQAIDVQNVAPDLDDVGRQFAFLGPNTPSWVAFLSGPGSHGLSSHWEPFNVFVFHYSGEKDWWVKEPVRKEPTRFDSHVRTYRDPYVAEALPKYELTLRPGDVLFIPRGGRHQAAAGPSGSAHVSLVLPAPSLYDLHIELATRVLTLIREQRRNRRYVTRGRGDELIADLRRGFVSAMDTLLASTSSEELADDLIDEAVTTSGVIYPRPDYQIRAGVAFRRTSAPIFARRRGTHAELIFGTRRCSFAIEVLPTLQWIAGGATFEPRDLLESLPKLGSEADARAWIEQLVRWGVLQEIERDERVRAGADAPRADGATERVG